MGCCRSKSSYVQDIYPDENVGIEGEPNNVAASGNINNLQTDTTVSATSAPLAKLALPSTPSTQTRKSLPFWCPICFNYFKDIYKMSCCSNYICEECSKAFIKKRMNLPSIKEVPSKPLDIACPLCATQRVTFAFETGDCANPRNYQESPHTRKAMLVAESRKSNKGESSQNASHNSLERVGEYDDDRETSSTRKNAGDRPTLTVLPGSVKAPTSPIPEGPEPEEDLAKTAESLAPLEGGPIEEKPSEETTPNPAAAVA